MNYKPIKSEQQYEEYLAKIERLMNSNQVGHEEEIELLGILIEAYESKHHPIPKVSKKELLLHLANEVEEIRNILNEKLK